MFLEFADNTAVLVSAEQKELWMLESRWTSGNCSSTIEENQNLSWQGGDLRSTQFLLWTLRKAQQLGVSGASKSG